MKLTSKYFLALCLTLFYWAAVTSIITGCSLTPAVTQQLSTETVYRRDMVISVNGITEEGVLVVPLAPTNSFQVTSPGELDMFAMTTCHREWTKENAGNVTQKVRSGLFGWGSKTITDKHKVWFDYVPVKGLEDSGACPVNLYGFDQQGKNSWGFVDFQTPEFTLKVHMGCNGIASESVGVAACQSRAGLYQTVRFDKTVTYSPDPGCDLGQPIANGFKFPLPKGVCTYVFEHNDANGKFLEAARLTLIGYDSILIRGDAK